MMDERSQSPWGMKVALYMFFEGAGAAGWLWVVLWDVFGNLPGLFTKPNLVITIGLVLIGVTFLWFDLGKKRSFYRVFVSLKYSWISRGALMVILFLILSLFYILISMEFFLWLPTGQGWKALFGMATTVPAFFMIVYPGMFLKCCKPYKLWDNPFMVILFIALSLLGGIAVIVLTVSGIALGYGEIAKANQVLQAVLGLSGGLLLGTITTLIIYLLITHSLGGLARVSVERFIQGNLSSYFIVAIGVGCILPVVLILPAFSVGGRGKVVLSAISAVSLLLGSLLLRYLVIVAPIRETVPEIPFIGLPNQKSKYETNL